MAVFIKKVNIPQKSDLINIDMTGSGTAQTYRVIKNVGGSVVEVIAMTDAIQMQFDSENTSTYAGKTLDTYCNTTWYNTLSATAKQAIVDKTFKQDSWYYGTSGNPIYQGKSIGDAEYQISLTDASFGNEITRHAYAISVQDVIDYLEVTPTMTTADTTLTYDNVWTMFWNSTTTHNGNIWLRSVYVSSSANRAFTARSGAGSLGSSYVNSSNVVRPAFQIDLSKIDYTFTDGRQPVELKPLSVLQKSNNTLSRVGMSYKVPIIYPTKSDIVDIDMTGSGTPQQFRILKINGSVAEVLGMANASDSQIFAINSNTYENSALDTLLNNTWYETLSTAAKLAIVDKTFRQDSWYFGAQGDPDYQGKKLYDISYQVSLSSISFGNEITRHCYALSVQDILDYLEVTPEMTASDTTLSYENIWKMFWRSDIPVSASYRDSCLRSVCVPSTSYVCCVNGYNGVLSFDNSNNRFSVRPAFQIDLSKIDFTIE